MLHIIDVTKEQFTDFAGEVIVNNLPSIDGLLPVQRKVLWALHKNKVTCDKNFIKLLRASAMTMVYYVFGDIPLAQAMKNMANNGIDYYYLSPKGSFGDKRKKEGVGASPRYIECKLSEYSQDLLRYIDKNIVPMKRNYDNTTYEPIILPSIIPNILINSSQSIAVGEASKMPSHNLNQVCDSIMNYLKNNNIDKSIEIIQCPDFNRFGGKIIYDKNIFKKIYKTGRGSFTLTGSYIYNKEENYISIIEVPYGTYIEDIEDKLEKSYEKGLFKEVTHIQNNNGRQGIQLDIYLKKNTNIQQFEQKLMKYTSYRSKFSCNFTILDLDGKTPILMSLKDIYDRWILHRQTCIKNELKFDINKLQIELNKLRGLEIINKDLDIAIKLIRSSKTEKRAIDKLISHFNLNQQQAEYISTIRLVNINEEWIFKRIQNINNLKEEILQLKNTLFSDEAINNIIISQLKEVKKNYGKPRQTKIIYEDEIKEIDEIQMIEEYSTYCILTKDNYLKKLKKKSDSIKLKDGDEIISEMYSSNKSTLLLFSNKGICYKIYEYEIDECRPSNLGEYLPQLLQLDKDEKIISMVSTLTYKGYLINCFESGKIAKIDLSSFETKTKRSKLENAINLESNLINQFIIEKDIDILCKSTIEKILIINTLDINSKGSKSTKGVNVLKSKNNSVMDMCAPLSIIDIEQITNMEYYKGRPNSVGVFLKKSDKIYKLS
ncbi:TPA: DNA gyrase subunit A [Clostridium botulinum]|nr:DNA gyrase subunit A [Clostridium botulinum]